MFLTNITTEARHLWHLGRALKPGETVEVPDDTAAEYEGHPHVAVTDNPPASDTTPQAATDEPVPTRAAEAEPSPPPAPDTPPADPPTTDPHTEETNPA
jgi:hypothetical protein